MADTTLVSYDLNGKKLSFANWISNLSPTETPFVSMTGKEAIVQYSGRATNWSFSSRTFNNCVVRVSGFQRISLPLEQSLINCIS